MESSSREKTAFTTPFGLFEFEVLPFRLHSVPATFQRLMNHILRDCQSFARAYIDDIVIFSHSREGEVFRCLVAANLQVKFKKCQFGRAKCTILVTSWSGED